MGRNRLGSILESPKFLEALMFLVSPKDMEDPCMIKNILCQS